MNGMNLIFKETALDLKLEPIYGILDSLSKKNLEGSEAKLPGFSLPAKN